MANHGNWFALAIEIASKLLSLAIHSKRIRVQGSARKRKRIEGLGIRFVERPIYPIGFGLIVVAHCLNFSRARRGFPNRFFGAGAKGICCVWTKRKSLLRMNTFVISVVSRGRLLHTNLGP